MLVGIGNKSLIGMNTPAVHRTERNVVPGIDYTFNPSHRNRMTKKSQWTISEEAELAAFVRASEHEWIINDEHAWGVHHTEGNLEYLGLAQDHNTEVFVAKFVNDVPHKNWHGYPADHQSNTQDIPPTSVLNDWIRTGLLKARKVRKIQRGQPCKL